MSEQENGFILYERPDGIFVLKLMDFEPETLQSWKDLAQGKLNQTGDPIKVLYEARHINTLPIQAIRTITSLQSHSNIGNHYFVALISNKSVAKVVSILASFVAKNNVRIMSDEAEAIQWLNEMLPPKNEATG